jgi:hypothetical protein
VVVLGVLRAEDGLGLAVSRAAAGIFFAAADMASGAAVRSVGCVQVMLFGDFYVENVPTVVAKSDMTGVRFGRKATE